MAATSSPAAVPPAMHLSTRHLDLVPQTRENIQALMDAMAPSDRAQLSADWLALFRASPYSDPWVHGFAAVYRKSGVTIGTASFKGPPTDGMVEIAYGVDAEQRGNGYATEIARALVAYAFAFPAVNIVRAHTLAEANASGRVLAKSGFERVGDFVDPEDGLVWRFEKRRRQA
jgi:[ribosomal protein S5]-alanine N-acetyltransferase